jgi:hypothetical protein
MKGADRRRWESTVAGGQGSGREAVAERSPRQNLDHRNTKRQGGRMRATSVLANAKSQIHQDASGRAAWPERTVPVLTQGDLARESGPGVSRGHSSEEGLRKQDGAKGRRNDCTAIRKPVSGAQSSSRGILVKESAVQDARMATPSGPRGLRSARCQPPDAENRTSGGVGALTGANPVRATRSKLREVLWPGPLVPGLQTFPPCLATQRSATFAPQGFLAGAG